MRYNTYRQYKTLSGVKKENKTDIIKNLTFVKKNLSRFIPKTVFNEFREKYTYISMQISINKDNSIRDMYINAYSSAADDTPVDSIKIQIPDSSYFYSINDPLHANNTLSLRAYKSNGSALTFRVIRLTWDSFDESYTVQTLNNQTVDYINDISHIIDSGRQYVIIGQDDEEDSETIFHISYQNLSYVNIRFDLTAVYNYDNLPKFLIKCPD